DDQPIRVSEKSARWCVEMTKLLWKNRRQRISEAERADAKKAFDHALAVLEEIAGEAANQP
ncbi:MAG: hypothetical protein MI861_24400, partial [Pirellulales bacterium]|nr:hypothetical protein [Pirellulales bacterium]